MAKTPTRPAKRRPLAKLAPIQEANGAGDAVQVTATAQEVYCHLAGRTGIVEYLEEGGPDHGLLDVQFPGGAGQEPAFVQLLGTEVCKVELPSAPEQHPVAYLALADIDLVRNTRQSYDEAALAELTESVRQWGVQQNIIVRPHPQVAGRYQLAAGHRRYLASQQAGLTTIPAASRPLTDVQFLEMQLLENLQREQVHPADEAVVFGELMEQHGYSAEEVGHKVGKSAQFVAQRAQLSHLVPEFMDVLRSGRLLVGAASLLARHPAPVQTALVARLNQSHDAQLTSSVVRHWVQDYMRVLAQAPFSLADPDLNPAMGPCTTCPQRTAPQTLLFPDLATEDCCLNPACYAIKVAVHVQQVAAQVQQQHGIAPVHISASYYTADKKVLDRTNYREVDVNVPGAVPAVFTDQRAGEVVYVKVNASEEQDSERRKEEREATIRKNNIQRRLNWLTVNMLATELGTAGPWRELLEKLVVIELGSYGGPSREQRAWLHEQWGWPTQHENYAGSQGMHNYLAAGIATLNERGLQALLIVWNAAKSAHMEYPTTATALAEAGGHLDLKPLRALAERQATAPARGKKPAATPEQLSEAIAEVMAGEEVANG